MDFPGLLAQLLNGVQYGLLLFLIASGLTLIFGVMGIINLAHGSLFMIGAYLAFLVARQWGSVWLALPVAVAERHAEYLPAQGGRRPEQGGRHRRREPRRPRHRLQAGLRLRAPSSQSPVRRGPATRFAWPDTPAVVRQAHHGVGETAQHTPTSS